jgi:hypothetical protein
VWSGKTTHANLDPFEGRLDPRPDEPRRLDTLHIFGTDTLSNDDVINYFKNEGYGPSHIEWINDASCNVVFVDQFTAKRALLGITTAVAPTVTAAEPAKETDGMDDAKMEVEVHPQSFSVVTAEEGQWRTGKDYIQRNRAGEELKRYKLILRYATKCK